MTVPPDQPVTNEEAERLFLPLARFKALIVAVSGGADSTALLCLVGHWAQDLAARREPAPKIRVATVDHALRPESAAECRSVEAMARSLGLEATTLVWTGAKPATGIQEAAREARYARLVEFAKSRAAEDGEVAVLTAHTMDDQAETVLMRLARGSGVDGLAGIQPELNIDGVTVVRPLLGVPKARLIATLKELGRPWIEDPSNVDTRFERPRLRSARQALANAGLEAEALATVARRARSASRALEAIARAPWREDPLLNRFGFAVLDVPLAESDEDEIALRRLQMLIGAVGGRELRLRRSQIEALLATVRSADFVSASLGGAVVERLARADALSGFAAAAGSPLAPPRPGAIRLLLARETGRAPLPRIELAPGATALWDGRFHLALDRASRSPVQVRALDAEEIRRFEAEDTTSPPGLATPLSRRLKATMPAVLWGDRCVGLAPLGLPREVQLACRFRGLTERDSTV